MDMAEVAEATEKLDPPVLKDHCGASEAFSAFVEKAKMKQPWQRHRTPEIFINELNAMRSV